MTAKTWNGTSSQFTDGAAWSPTGAPQPGDTATISSGTVSATGLNLQGLGISVLSNTTVGGNLMLIDSTIAAGSMLTINNPNGYGSGAPPTLAIQGTTTNSGTINMTGSVIQIPVSGTLVNRGRINLIDASPQVQAASGAATPVIENDGAITVNNPDGAFQSPVVNANITGTGTIGLGANAGLDLRQGVSAGQTVAFSGGVNGQSILQLEQPGNFAATIGNFVLGNSITISNTPYDSSAYTSTGSQSGVLSLFSQGTLQGQLHFSGVYNQSNFALNFTPLGGGGSNLQILTNVTNAATGSTNLSDSVGAIFRFFDTRFGTHFFTADQGEKNTVLATRPDLVEETNGFGDVTQSDPNAAPVFRFFDTTYGTHFFTSNAGERDAIIATRPDLTYEANSTFYEHATQQAGDVAVYRLFDMTYGTQFLTGDQGEYNGITTPGTATFRTDLRSEGIAFYAPVGTFT